MAIHAVSANGSLKKLCFSPAPYSSCVIPEKYVFGLRRGTHCVQLLAQLLLPEHMGTTHAIPTVQLPCESRKRGNSFKEELRGIEIDDFVGAPNPSPKLSSQSTSLLCVLFSSLDLDPLCLGELYLGVLCVFRYSVSQIIVHVWNLGGLGHSIQLYVCVFFKKLYSYLFFH